MGHRVSEGELRTRATKFFMRVVDVLMERNRARGDSYLEMDLEDFAALFRDKGGRIKTIARQDLTAPNCRKELLDSVLDEAGYAALCAIWCEENLEATTEEWDAITRR